MFTQRSSLPNHFSQQTPQSKLQQLGHSIIVQDPAKYNSIAQTFQERNRNQALAQLQFQQEGRVGQDRAIYLSNRFQ
jgi:hypothetical protein